jgi:uracil-DNA glycosylase
VIIGQDPYHQEGQANGLAFSVNRGIALPPSLRNMLNELRDEYPKKSIQAIEHGGDLTIWAKQGVLLLNSLLSVQASNPLSHKNIGWENLLPLVIRKINEQVDDVVFLLWGKQAQSFKSLIDIKKHVVIEGVHPSPLSAYRGFFGSKPFSTINELLMSRGKSPIEW